MKKLLFTILCIVTLGNYNQLQKNSSDLGADAASASTGSGSATGSAGLATVTQPTAATSSSTVATSGSSTGTTATQTTMPPATATTPAAAVPVVSNGAFKDGTYTGSSVSAHYGNVQVEITVSGGELAEVVALKYPSDRTSLRINNQALPLLYSEAIKAQSSKVNMITGATFTSRAFISSLESALKQART